jgi:hypothetical protein
MTSRKGRSPLGRLLCTCIRVKKYLVLLTRPVNKGGMDLVHRGGPPKASPRLGASLPVPSRPTPKPKPRTPVSKFPVQQSVVKAMKKQNHENRSSNNEPHVLARFVLGSPVGRYVWLGDLPVGLCILYPPLF